MLSDAVKHGDDAILAYVRRLLTDDRKQAKGRNTPLTHLLIEADKTRQQERDDTAREKREARLKAEATAAEKRRTAAIEEADMFMKKKAAAEATMKMRREYAQMAISTSIFFMRGSIFGWGVPLSNRTCGLPANTFVFYIHPTTRGDSESTSCRGTVQQMVAN